MKLNIITEALRLVFFFSHSLSYKSDNLFMQEVGCLCEHLLFIYKASWHNLYLAAHKLPKSRAGDEKLQILEEKLVKMVLWKSALRFYVPTKQN